MNDIDFHYCLPFLTYFFCNGHCDPMASVVSNSQTKGSQDFACCCTRPVSIKVRGSQAPSILRKQCAVAASVFLIAHVCFEVLADYIIIIEAGKSTKILMCQTLMSGLLTQDSNK